MTPGLLLLVSLLLSALFGAACLTVGFWAGLRQGLSYHRARAAALYVLHAQDRHREDILRAIGTSYGVDLPVWLVVALLQLLQQEGLVYAWDSGKLPEGLRDGRGRVYFGLTETGRQAAREGT
jgi:DNA-binding PadR family transcriptional regulator